MSYDFIPYTPEDAEAFFAQLEQWTDADEYSRCIQALDAIPEEQRDYRASYALARALENYAIIGDHGEGTPKSEGDAALLRALAVLESIREEGQDRAEWNMRMAYAYQYLSGQEEKAIPYAQRWAELDPGDENAPKVLAECQEAIAKRSKAGEAEADGEQNNSPSKGSFTGTVLLAQAAWDREQFIQELRQDWGIVDEGPEEAGEEGDGHIAVLRTQGLMLAAALFPGPVSHQEAEAAAQNNYLWPQALDAAQAHRAQIMVTVLGGEGGLLEAGKLFTKALAVCCKQKHATGIYTSGVVFEPAFYAACAQVLQEGQLPVYNWLWFGLRPSKGGLNAYTCGMEAFGKDEMEVLDAAAQPEELRNFLADLATHVLEDDVVFSTGETCTLGKGDYHSITRSPGVSLPQEQLTLKISYQADVDQAEGRIYDEAELAALRAHIERYFGPFEKIYHQLDSPDSPVDICVIPPNGERDYYTLVTLGMGTQRMNVPAELAGEKLERAELAIALDPQWKLDQESLQNEEWNWPLRLLAELAGLPIRNGSWLGWGHTVANRTAQPFADNTKLCASLLLGPQGTEDESQSCTLPNGEEVNFYQVLPLYKDELDYKLKHDTEALLDKMWGISFVVTPARPSALSRGTLARGDFDAVMDDARWHLESIWEKELPVEELSAYNHMAIYLRWCMEQGLMGEDFLQKHGQVVQQLKAEPASVDLRAFLRDELEGRLAASLFNQQGCDFAGYYYGEGDSPNFPCDIDDYALKYFGAPRYHSAEFKDEAYLFIPFDEAYYQAMAKVMEKRYKNWQGQDYDKDSLIPSKLAKALMEYLNCKCSYLPSMKDDDPITSAYSYAWRLGVREGYVPVLIKADDEALWKCLVTNADPEHDAYLHPLDPKTVAEYRKQLLAAPVKDGKAVLEGLAARPRAGEDGIAWEESSGQREGGAGNNRFASYWNDAREMTYPLILAQIPVQNPWEVFAYLPFGNWNQCPDTPELMAVAKYWFERYGAVPAVLSHDELEFLLPSPVPAGQALELAEEQRGFCPAVLDQEEAALGALAATLGQSAVWYFWWD